MAEPDHEFDAEMERLVWAATAAHLQDVAWQMGDVLADLARLHRGKPVAEIKPMLTAAFNSRGWTISEPDLTEYATRVSDGTQIEVKPQIN